MSKNRLSVKFYVNLTRLGISHTIVTHSTFIPKTICLNLHNVRTTHFDHNKLDQILLDDLECQK